MKPDFRHDDVLAKMDALLKRHHDVLPRPAVADDFPLLTEVVEEVAEQTVDDIPVLTEVIERVEAVLEQDEAEASCLLPPAGVDELRAQLDSRIMEALEQRLPFHIVEAVDNALPVVFEELSLQLERLVREAVAQELERQLARLPLQGKSGDAAE